MSLAWKLLLLKQLMLNPSGEFQWPNFNPRCTWTLGSINTVDSPLSPKEVSSPVFQEPIFHCSLLGGHHVFLSVAGFSAYLGLYLWPPFLHSPWGPSGIYRSVLFCCWEVLFWLCMPHSRAHILCSHPSALVTRLTSSHLPFLVVPGDIWACSSSLDLPP